MIVEFIILAAIIGLYELRCYGNRQRQKALELTVRELYAEEERMKSHLVKTLIDRREATETALSDAPENKEEYLTTRAETFNEVIALVNLDLDR